jgi:hypothetical protein
MEFQNSAAGIDSASTRLGQLPGMPVPVVGWGWPYLLVLAVPLNEGGERAMHPALHDIGIGSYSRKVPQQAGTQADLGALSGTVTCTETRGWTGCRWMACKRSGVRIPIAPLGVTDRTAGAVPTELLW